MLDHAKILESYINSLLKNKSVDEVNDLLNQVILFSNSLTSNQNVWLFLNSPLMGTDEKKSFLKNFAEKSNVNILVVNFFILMVKNKRLNLIPLLPKISKEYMDKNNNISNIQFVAPVDLDEKGKVKLKEKLKSMGIAKANLSYKIDESLISGFKLITGDQEYDFSLKSVLNQFQEKLTKGVSSDTQNLKTESAKTEIS